MPANPYAPPAAPVEGGKKRGSVKGIVWALVALLALAGVFAAVAVPAYYDRVYRSRVAAAVWTARPAQEAITEHFREHKRMPERLAELPPELKLGAGGMLTWTFRDDAGDIGRATIVFRPRADGDTLLWDCTGGTLAGNYRVPSCR